MSEIENPGWWSAEAEHRRHPMFDRQNWKSHLPFWPGRRTGKDRDNPLISDGELTAIAARAMRDISEAQHDLADALHLYTDGSLSDVAKSLRTALSAIELLRQRTVGAADLLDQLHEKESAAAIARIKNGADI